MRHLLWPVLALLFALCLGAAAVIPLDVRVGVAADGERWRLRLRVAAPWGFPRLSVCTGSTAKVNGAGAGRPGRSRTRRTHRSARKRRGPGMLQGWRAAGRLGSTMRVDGLRLTLRLGLGDAAATAVACGVLWALLSALVAGLPALPARRAHVRVGPAYGPARLHGALVMRAHLAVWQAAWVALALVWPGRRG